jgi:hypothetical protein
MEGYSLSTILVEASQIKKNGLKLNMDYTSSTATTSKITGLLLLALLQFPSEHLSVRQRQQEVATSLHFRGEACQA